MNISMLSLFLSLLAGGPQTPNFYGGLTSAREASKKTGKEMLVFFSDQGCTGCESAWAAFVKDPNATNQYISTRMDADNFDGRIFFDLLQLKQPPTWVIFLSDGTEKTRWEGGWKDKNGQPILFDNNTQEVVKQESSNITPNASKPVSISTPKDQTTSAIPNSLPSIQSSEVNSGSTSTSTISQTGLVLQAGFFGLEENAKKLVTELDAKGFVSFTVKALQQNGKTFYRVISKVFQTEADAQNENQKLALAGIKASIKKISEL